MFSKKTRIIVVSLSVMALVLVLSGVLLFFLVQRPSVQNYILKRVSSAIDKEVVVRNIELDVTKGIGLRANDLSIRSRSGNEYLYFKKITALFDTWQLLRGHFVPVKLVMVHPKAVIRTTEWAKPAKGVSKGNNGASLWKALGGMSISIEDGDIWIKDIPLRLKRFNGQIICKGFAPLTYDTEMSTVILYRGKEGKVHLSGMVAHRPAFSMPSLDMVVKLYHLPFDWFPPQDSFVVRKGSMDATLNIKADRSYPVTAKASIDLKDSAFTVIDDGDTQDYSFPSLSLKTEISYADKRLALSSIRLKGPDFNIDSDISIDIKDISNPYLHLEVSTPFMSLATLKKLFPASVVCPWVADNILPLLSKGRGRVKRFALDGTVEQISNIEIPGNESALSMSLELKGIEALKDAGGIPCRDISAVVSIESGKLFISDVRGKFGSSVLENGFMSLTNIYRDEDGMRYHIMVDGDFDLSDIEAQTSIKFVPEEVKKISRQFKKISGHCKTNLEVTYDTAWKYPRIDKGKINFRNCSFENAQMFLPVHINEGNISIEKGRQNIFRARGRWGKSLFQLSGRSSYSWNTLEASVMGNADLNEIAETFHLSTHVSFNRVTLCNGSVTKRDNRWTVKGEIGIVPISTRNLSLFCPLGKREKVRFRLDLKPKKSVSVHSKWFLANSRLNLNLKYFPIKKKTLLLHVDTNGLALKDINILFKGLKHPIGGTVSCRLDANIPLADPFNTWIKGNFRAQDLFFSPSGLPFSFEKWCLNVNAKGKALQIKSLEGNMGNSRIHVNGKITGGKTLDGSLELVADYIDADQIITMSKVMMSGQESLSLPEFLKRANVAGRINVKKGRWRKLDFGPLKAECRITPEGFFVKEANVKMAHGELALTGCIKKDETAFDSKISLEDQPIEELLDTLNIAKGTFEGPLTIKGHVASRGKDIRSLVKGLSGDAEFLVKEGKVQHFNMVFKILNFLSLKKILTLDYNDVFKQGFYFDSIKGSVTADKGVLKTEHLIMKSDTFNMAGKGYLDLAKNTVDLDLAVMPLGSVDFIISHIPIIGYIITGKDKAFIVYNFKVDGNLSDPDIRYIPLKNMGKDTIDFFKRLFLTPNRIFKKISRTTGYIFTNSAPYAPYTY